MNDFFDRSEILSILQGFNPWWVGRAYSVPPFHRLAYHACQKYLNDPKLRRAILLSGPRRVGKTTILTQTASALVKEGLDPKSVFFVSLDHPLLKLMALPRILRLYHESVYPEGKPVVLLLDEVHYSDDWELHIKQLIDHKPEYRTVATGSASVIHRQQLAESGVGRWVRMPMPTLSFYEFVHIRGDEPPVVAEDLRPVDLFKMHKGEFTDLGARFRGLMPVFLHYLLVGGFPETATHPDIRVCQRLLREDVVERVLKRDMTALFGIRNVNDLEKLFIYLCLHSGGIFAVQTAASQLGTTAATISNHLEALEQANLIYRVAPAGTGGKAVLKARYKIYLVDAALRNAVLLRGEEIKNNSDEMGTIVETTVLRHLYAYYYQDTPEIVYWRDAASGKEVDFIVRSPRYLIPVEVKYRDDAGLGEKEGIVGYSRNENVSAAYWVTRREQDFEWMEFDGLATRFLKIPAHIFTYLLGQAERLLWLK
jgi:hypothetical protein